MKKYKLYSLAAAAALTMGLTSCGEDFLTEDIRGQQNLDNYFQSIEECESYMVSCCPLNIGTAFRKG